MLRRIPKNILILQNVGELWKQISGKWNDMYERASIRHVRQIIGEKVKIQSYSDGFSCFRQFVQIITEFAIFRTLSLANNDFRSAIFHHTTYFRRILNKF